MRLIGQQKMGFYPTPPEVTQIIRTWLDFPSESFAALDPCCGEGEALRDCLDGTPGVGYAVELDGGRALEASKVLAKVICADALSAQVPPRSFSLLWLNPPYDNVTAERGEKQRRAEEAFLQRYAGKLAPDGILVYVVPQNRLEGRVARLLAYYLRGARWRIFPQPLYGRFRQAVVVGARKEQFVEDKTTAAAIEAFSRAGAAAPAWAERSPGEQAWAVPAAPPQVEGFGGTREIDLAAANEALRGSGCWTRLETQLGAGRAREAGRPPVTPHRGHLALQLAAGEIDGVVGTGAARHVVRGVAQKHTVEEKREHETIIDGQPEVVYRTYEVDRFRITVRAMGPDGTIKTLGGGG